MKIRRSGYESWKRTNPGKTIEDYDRQYALSEAEQKRRQIENEKREADRASMELSYYGRLLGGYLVVLTALTSVFMLLIPEAVFWKCLLGAFVLLRIFFWLRK